MQKNFVNIVFGAIVVLAVGIIIWWATSDPTQDFNVSKPGEDNRDKGNVIEQIVKIGEKFQFLKNMIQN